MRQVRRNVANGSALALNVEQRDATFGGGIKLKNLRNGKTVFEPVPHFGRQSVATGHPDTMTGLVRRRRGVEQVTAKLTNVLEEGAVPVDNIVPELAGGKIFPDHEGAAGDQNRSWHLHTANAVIHGQAVIHPVG